MSNAALKSSSTKMTPPPPHYQRPRIGHYFVHEELLSLCCGVACKQTEISHMSCLFSNALLIEHKQCVQQGNKVWNKWGVGVEGGGWGVGVCGGGGGGGGGGGWGWGGGGGGGVEGVVVVAGTPYVRVSRDVPPFRPPFSPQVHPLDGYSNVKHIPVGYHIFVLSHSLKFHPADTPVGVKIHPADPSPLPVSGRSALFE